MISEMFHPGSAMIGDWTMRRIRLDERGRDATGWLWGSGRPLWHITDGIDSLTGTYCVTCSRTVLGYEGRLATDKVSSV